MKKLITLAAVFMLAGCTDLTSCSSEVVPASFAQEANRPGEYSYLVDSVYDGDTFRITMPGLPSELNPMKVRIRGIDSPERGSPQCDAERAGATRARIFAEQTLRGQTVILRNIAWDKYGGRINADVLVGPERASFATMLIAGGHARPYTTGRRGSWC